MCAEWKTLEKPFQQASSKFQTTSTLTTTVRHLRQDLSFGPSVLRYRPHIDMNASTSPGGGRGGTGVQLRARVHPKGIGEEINEGDAFQVSNPMAGKRSGTTAEEGAEAKDEPGGKRHSMTGENETVLAMRGLGARARSVDLGSSWSPPTPTATTPRPAAGTAAAANATADVWNVDDGTWCSWMGKTGAFIVAIYVVLLIQLSFVVLIHSTRLLSVSIW